MYEQEEHIENMDEEEGGIDRRTVIGGGLFVGCFSIAVGLGYLVGPGMGWLFAGMVLIAVVVAASLARESAGDGR